ncbi:phosphatase PAP2 family protein [Rariglobus hedericola]|uniref:phosphatase PAP2 family protein n=1 Tax=Rariglobus hedericola TaxID=2597822 RepID=UPI001EF042B2|nr:phosphatase PAP2 family protein [Rariglobus hedericola]
MLGGLRGDHAWLVLAALAVYYAGPRLRAAGRFLLPLLIMVTVYDSQQYWALSLRATVNVAGPHALELALFGVRDGDAVTTLSAWLQTHTHALLDLVCGVAYLAFVPVFLLVAAWWRFVKKIPGAEGVMWAMLWLNLAAYVIWMIYPAAPPWYADHYGLGPAVLTAAPEAAGAARFDALLGVTWFADYYAKNTNVFGAIPSLHVGQTFLAALFAWRFRSLRIVMTGFWLLVMFSSVYLNHHYLVDGLAGMALATVAWAVMRRSEERIEFHEPTLVTAADEPFWRCLYQLLLSVERHELNLRQRVVVWDLGLSAKTLARLKRRFPWALFHTLDFSQLPEHVKPEKRTYAWKPVVIHRTMEIYGGKLLWLDSAAIIRGPWTEMTESIDQHGLYLLAGQSALRLRCDPAVVARLAVPEETMDQREFVSGLVGVDTRRPAVRVLLVEWQQLALDARDCPPRHAGNNPEQVLLTILVRQGVMSGELTVNSADIDISSSNPVRWVSSRNKVPMWLPVWADPFARAWYVIYKAGDRAVLRFKAASR